MIPVETTTQTLEVKLTGAVATNQLPIVANYIEKGKGSASAGNRTVGRNLQTNGVTAVIVMPAPTISVARELIFLSVQNRDTAPVTLILQLNDNATLRQILKATLAVNDSLFYEEGNGFYCIDASGNLKVLQATGGTAVWGTITGTLSDQLDLQAALDANEDDSMLDTDGTMAANSDAKIPSQKAVKTYVDASVLGLWDDRGSFDASVNAYPAAGGSGAAGAILKGDIWTVSVAGTLPVGQVVNIGDTVRALIDTPGNLQANWAITENNIGYVPENQANKDTDSTFAANSDIKYPSQKAVKTAFDLKENIISGITAAGIDAYTAAYSPVPVAYAVGQKFIVIFTSANTGASTLNLNALGPIPIKKNVTEALEAGDIAAGQVLLLSYDGTNMQVIGGGGISSTDLQFLQVAAHRFLTNN